MVLRNMVRTGKHICVIKYNNIYVRIKRENDPIVKLNIAHYYLLYLVAYYRYLAAIAWQ